MTSRLLACSPGGCPYIKTGTHNNLTHKYIHISLYYINNIAQYAQISIVSRMNVRKIQKITIRKNVRFLRKSVRNRTLIPKKSPPHPPYIHPPSENIISTSIFQKLHNCSVHVMSFILSKYIFTMYKQTSMRYNVLIYNTLHNIKYML